MPKLADRPERRQSFAQAAVEAIGTLGIDAVRLRDIAQAADATTGAITHYFDGKDAVLEAALDAMMQRLLQRAAAAPLPADPGEAAAAVARTLPIDAESARDWRVWVAFWGRAAFSEPLRASHGAHYARLVELLVVHAGLSPDAADALIAAVDGVGTRATLEPGHWPPERQARTLALLIEPLLANRKEAP
jgi:TetR/AcrR family transcriptional repressor of bet genes